MNPPLEDAANRELSDEEFDQHFPPETDQERLERNEHTIAWLHREISRKDEIIATLIALLVVAFLVIARLMFGEA